MIKEKFFWEYINHFEEKILHEPRLLYILCLIYMYGSWFLPRLSRAEKTMPAWRIIHKSESRCRRENKDFCKIIIHQIFNRYFNCFSIFYSSFFSHHFTNPVFFVFDKKLNFLLQKNLEFNLLFHFLKVNIFLRRKTLQ